MTLTHARLTELFLYDPTTGIFTRKVRTARRTKAGEQAGGTVVFGHIALKIDGRRYRAHRLAWFYVHAEWPEAIDHINGIPSDNRIANLRPCVQADNMKNCRKSKANTSGFKGVYALPGGRWRAMITADHKTISLGCYASKELAADAYDKAAVKFHGEFARTNQSLR